MIFSIKYYQKFYSPNITLFSDYMSINLSTPLMTWDLVIEMTNFTMQLDRTHSRRLILVCFLEIVPDVNFSNKLY